MASISKINYNSKLYTFQAEKDSDGNVINLTYLKNTGGKVTGDITATGTVTGSNITATGTVTGAKLVSTGDITATGTVTASRVNGAWYNDYAELFPSKCGTKGFSVGDIICVDADSDVENYVKSSSSNKHVVGVFTNRYAHLIGGVMPPNGEDLAEYNKDKYIPVSLTGRVYCKVVGKVDGYRFLVSKTMRN